MTTLTFELISPPSSPSLSRSSTSSSIASTTSSSTCSSTTTASSRLSHILTSRASASGSSTWHTANAVQGWNVSSSATLPASAAEGKGKQKKGAIAPVEVAKPERCMVRRGNGDSDGLAEMEREVDELGVWRVVTEVEVPEVRTRSRSRATGGRARREREGRL